MSQVSEELLVPLEEVDECGWVSDLLTLTKARLSLLVIVTTFVGYCMGSGACLHWMELMHATLGTALAAASAAVLNQWLETHVDRLMERTRTRPLPAGRMSRRVALFLGIGLGLVGVMWLWLTTNWLSAVLAGATIAIYLFLYTPLKRRTSACTLVGAVSGALPPMIGWTAAQGPDLGIGAGGWILFGILFTWQMPHFLAIAWMYRDEYAQAGFVMLKREDASGCVTGFISLMFALALAAVSVAAYYSGMAGRVYLLGALVLNAGLVGLAVRFFLDRNRSTARALFFGSILFLPLLLGLMVFSKA
jgi:protoheme IX farnesyltransferase